MGLGKAIALDLAAGGPGLLTALVGGGARAVILDRPGSPGEALAGERVSDGGRLQPLGGDVHDRGARGLDRLHDG